MAKKIGLASDHAGFELKECLENYLFTLGYEVEDFGTHTLDSVDYPDYAHPLANSVEQGQCDLGIGLCGSGQGMNITLNKHQGIRSSLCWIPEIASMTRLHNDANVLVLPARYIDEATAKAIVEAFLTTEFEGGRHIDRIKKITTCC